jgi:hypothetical protein
MSDLPSENEPETTLTDDHGAALERAAESIHEAHDAEGRVAAHGDITTADDAKAGEYSEDPDGTGGHP